MLRKAHSPFFQKYAHRALVFLIAFGIGITPFSQVHAQLQNSTQQLNRVATSAGVAKSTDLLTIIGRIINIFLGLLGIIFLVILLYAGYLYLMGGGDPEQIKKARLYIRNAIIGLVIIASAWAITAYLFKILAETASEGGGVSDVSKRYGTFESSAGSLGQTIEMHYPYRDATNVPRNTKIIITFKKPVKLSSLMNGYDDKGTPADLKDDVVTEGLNDVAVKIYRTSAGVSAALPTARMRVRFTEDRKTFVFTQVNCPQDLSMCFGSDKVNVGYTVWLQGGKDGVLQENGDPFFAGDFQNGYKWNFEVGTELDLTPPQVSYTIPTNNTSKDRNIVIQAMFSEVVDPTSANGSVRGGQGFQNIQVHAGGPNTPPLDGEFKATNQLQGVEFTPTEYCGKNTCGQDMFCLPGGTSIDLQIRSASLDGTGPAAQFTSAGYDGVVDAAGNALDGSANGKTEGPGLDDYSVAFGTTNDINLSVPTIEETVPSHSPADTGYSNIDPFMPVRARFNDLLRSSTWNTDNTSIQTHEPPELVDTFWHQTGIESLGVDNQPLVQPTDVPFKTLGFITHRMYASSTEYDPFIFSGVQNQYQNCFNPVSSPRCPVNPAKGQNCCWGQRQRQDCAFP
jgi:hypothetical protein